MTLHQAGPNHVPSDRPLMLTQRHGSLQVRAWLQKRAHASRDQGLLAAQIPGMWAQDHPGSSLPLKEMGVKKLNKFLLACCDIVRTVRPIAAGMLQASDSALGAGISVVLARGCHASLRLCSSRVLMLMLMVRRLCRGICQMALSRRPS